MFVGSCSFQSFWSGYTIGIKIESINPTHAFNVRANPVSGFPVSSVPSIACRKFSDIGFICSLISHFACFPVSIGFVAMFAIPSQSTRVVGDHANPPIFVSDFIASKDHEGFHASSFDSPSCCPNHASFLSL